MDSKRIAEKIGASVTIEKVEILMELAEKLYGDLQETTKTPFDYSAYLEWADQDLPPFTPQPGKRGPKETPVRQFLRHFFPIAEYMMSSTHDQVQDRVGVPKVLWRFEGNKRVHSGGRKLPADQQFDALNELGKLVFLITKEFYPDVSIGGKTDRSKNRDGDFHALLHPKGNRYDMTPKQMKSHKEKSSTEDFVADLVAELGRERVQIKFSKDPDRWRNEVEVFNKNFPIKT